MRGEYNVIVSTSPREAELPPRARRIPPADSHWTFSLGTTSACAENTRHPCYRPGRRRNYLRVRGEYYKNPWELHKLTELPPRARRILGGCTDSGVTVGTTSACAENTHGANSILLLPSELPPRARRIPAIDTREVIPVGTTSACAENTPSNNLRTTATRNYLRVRGEYPK